MNYPAISVPKLTITWVLPTVTLTRLLLILFHLAQFPAFTDVFLDLASVNFSNTISVYKRAPIRMLAHRASPLHPKFHYKDSSLTRSITPPPFQQGAFALE